MATRDVILYVRCVGDGDDAAIWCCLRRGAAIYTLQLDWRADVRLGDAVTSVAPFDDDDDDDDDGGGGGDAGVVIASPSGLYTASRTGEKSIRTKTHSHDNSFAHIMFLCSCYSSSVLLLL